MNTNTEELNMTTQDLIKHLRQLMPLGPQIATLVNVAADRLEELQRELTETILERYKTVALLIKQRDEANAEVERLKQQLSDAPQIRPEPSRLEVAAMLMGAHVYHLGLMYQEGLTLRQACLIEADALIAAAKETK
jgi:predicted nuclease with TOPRIM domain